MFDELKKYNQNDHFFFKPTDDLRQACNAPTDRSGIYLIYVLKAGKVELVYIGRSGEVKSDGSLFVRKAGIGGLKDRLINGKQFGQLRRNSWKTQMLTEKIEALDVYWYATHCNTFVDCPRVIENKLLQKFYDSHRRLPKWNNEM